ncbi:MAG TPA: hypothetical protein VHJ77_18135 [Vicinamibacterales bacterium]|jgi:hypothetical protein|nr:hypothetical protein [Vicinamibacterales bacterium]
MRRNFLSLLAGLTGLGFASPLQSSRKMKILIKSAHEVQIFLLGEGVSLMRTAVANSVFPVGWPALSEGLAKTIQKKTPIHV